MRKHHLVPCMLLIVLFLFSISVINISYANQYISIKQVIDNNSKNIHEGYVFGKTKYKKWEYVGLNEYFKIRIKAETHLEPDDLTEIILKYKERESSISSALLMDLTPKGAGKMMKISEKYQESRVSIEIGNEIISIPTIVGYLNDSVKLYIDIEKFDDVSQLLVNSYNNVKIIK